MRQARTMKKAADATLRDDIQRAGIVHDLVRQVHAGLMSESDAQDAANGMQLGDLFSKTLMEMNAAAARHQQGRQQQGKGFRDAAAAQAVMRVPKSS